MADTKITDLAAAGTLATGDLLPVVDVSDTSMAASGTDKKLPLSDLRSFLAVRETMLCQPVNIAANQAAGTYWANISGSVIASGSGSTNPPFFVVYSSTDWPGVANMVLNVSLTTTAVQTGVTFTFGLYPVTISGTTSITCTLGTVVSGSTVAFSAPGTASENRGNSGSFTAPSADLYVIGCVTDASTVSASRTGATATLLGTRS